MTKRIFRSTLAVGLAVLLASLAVVMGWSPTATASPG